MYNKWKNKKEEYKYKNEDGKLLMLLLFMVEMTDIAKRRWS